MCAKERAGDLQSVIVSMSGCVGGCAHEAAKSFKLGKGMQECSLVILIRAKFLCQKNSQPATLQFDRDWRRIDKRVEERLKERRNKGRKGARIE